MVKQFLSPGFERDLFYECPSCSEAITNPLCHDCLGQAVAKWLSFYPDVKRKVMPKLKTYIRNINNEANGAVNCVTCNNKKAALCPYCFSEGVFNLLKKNSVNRNIIGDFLTIFNFDSEHKGYILEAQEQGFY
jgi:hypothetical protein